MFSCKDQGLIQLESNELFVMKDQPHIIFEVLRLHSFIGETEVNWKVIYENETLPKTFGKVLFEDGEESKSITASLDNHTLNGQTTLELFEPTTLYKLGVNKIAKISPVCKLSHLISLIYFIKILLL